MSRFPMLFARRGDVSLALASSCDWRARSCGYVGVSDGWRQLREHRRVGRNLYDAGRRRGPADRLGRRRGATVAAGCGREAGQRGEQTDHVLHGVTFRGASVDTDAPVAESSV